jgi:acyl-[acyl carrier protein]--UDP-N-acetylglucosamine O-acyltransferase
MNSWSQDENGNKIHVTAIIGDNVELGKNNTIYPYSVIGVPGFIRDAENSTGKVKIGNNNKIGTHTAIMVGQDGTTEIGDNNLIMNYVNIGHDTIIGSDNEIGAGTVIAGWVKIGDCNKIKIRCTIRNRKKITNGNIIGMCSNITKDFESDRGWLIYGNPAKQIKLAK